MPEYLAPGVYVEEVSFRSKSIEGVSTTTTGMVGPTRYGPIDLTPDVITSLGEFERIYGDKQQLEFSSGGLSNNYVWHGARAFFGEGGQRLYVARSFRPVSTADDGRARWPSTGFGTANLTVAARFPGAAGNMRVVFTFNVGANVLAQEGVGSAARTLARGLFDLDVVLITYPDLAGPPTSPLQSPLLKPVTSPVSTPIEALNYTFGLAAEKTDSSGRPTWEFATGLPAGLSDKLTIEKHFRFDPASPETSPSIRVVTVNVTVYPDDPDMPSMVWQGLALDPSHTLNGAADSLNSLFAAKPPTLGQARSLPIVVQTTQTDGLQVMNALLSSQPANRVALEQQIVDMGLSSYASKFNPYSQSSDADRSLRIELKGGNDGLLPELNEYEGTADVSSTAKTGLKSLEDIDDISIVIAPGSTFNYDTRRPAADSIIGAVLSHVTKMRYRVAIIDSGNGQSVGDVRAMRGKFDSTYAGLYYPWVTVMDPVTRKEIDLPPSGFVAGIYARNDINRGVYKAPANEVVTLAVGFETVLNKAQQDVLNPIGVNCFRFFEGRGNRLWGARTISSDPEWKYVNVRRYFAYLEHSVDKGTQWAVFEPNGDRLWGSVRRTIEDFLFIEWQNGALLGEKPEKAYFVKCDRTTMTQNDLDNGRLVCLVGVAPIKPAEFVIFRIGQWTADQKV